MLSSELWQWSVLNKMPLDHACMTDQKFSCGFKSHVIGEYAIGLSKSNQSLHGFSTCTAFCSEFAQIKTWEKPPIKAKYLVTLHDQPVYSHGMQFSFCPLIGNCLGRSWMFCMLKLQFRLWREAQKVTQFFEFFVEITLLWYKILIWLPIQLTTSMTKAAREWDKKKKNIWERQKEKPVNSEFIF